MASKQRKIGRKCPKIKILDRFPHIHGLKPYKNSIKFQSSRHPFVCLSLYVTQLFLSDPTDWSFWHFELLVPKEGFLVPWKRHDNKISNMIVHDMNISMQVCISCMMSIKLDVVCIFESKDPEHPQNRNMIWYEVYFKFKHVWPHYNVYIIHSRRWQRFEITI